MKVVMYLERELVEEIFLLGGVFILFEGCSEDFYTFSFIYLLNTSFLYFRSCDHSVIAKLVFI